MWTNAAALRWVPTPEDLVELDEIPGRPGNCPGSGNLQRPLRQPHPEPVDHLDAGLVGGGGGAEGDEERRVVLDGRVGVRHARGVGAIARQLVHVAAGERLAGPGVEVAGPPR